MTRRIAPRLWLSSPEGSRTTRYLCGIIAIALLLRVWGIGFGLPHELTYDEIHEILRALKLGLGEYQWSFGKGGLYYVLFLEYGLLYIVWWLLGDVSGPREFAMRYVQDPSAFFLLGRYTVALMGVITCWVVFAVGRRTHSIDVGLGAALIGATAYYHGYSSHIINVDVGMTLAVWSSVLAYLKFENSGMTRWLMAAGVLAGVAIAFKLPGGIALFALLCAIGTNPDNWTRPGRAIANAFVAGAAALLTLTIVAPEWIPALGGMSSHFTQAVGPAVSQAISQAISQADSQVDATRLAIDSITIMKDRSPFSYLSVAFLPHNLVLTLMAILGCVMGLRARQRWTIVWTLTIVAYLVIMSAGERSPHQRYLMPLSPALWLLASQAILGLGRRKRWVAVTGFVIVVSIPLAGLVYENHMLTRPDTRIVAKDWVEENIPAGAKILVDGMNFRFVMSPPLHPDEESIRRITRQASDESRSIEGKVLTYAPGEPGWGGGAAGAWELYIEAMSRIDRPAYALYSTVYGLQVRTMNYYVTSCFDYIITSSDISKRYVSRESKERFPGSARFYEQVESDPRVELVFSASPARWQMSGPRIGIYRLATECA